MALFKQLISTKTQTSSSSTRKPPGSSRIFKTPQTPIVRTKSYEKYNIDDYPLGTNAIVAVLAYSGYDMEDAMVLNKSSVDRGMCHGYIYQMNWYGALWILNSWDGGGIDGSEVVEKGQERVNMVVNFEKSRRGYFQIRKEGGEIFVSLLNMKERFTFMKAVNMEKVIYDIIEKFELTSFLAYS
ncbi:unnamed protein product [Fraxinus pennsylvanica]|uniref:DNA-directed RNA polymerase n=1 Tax=Fraxinus pennsylvanica TaxID=56036 RepID=A0AAD2E4J8_9LAMI|nr:unnamed protein product [Fraxinus pennsylvanica]